MYNFWFHLHCGRSARSYRLVCLAHCRRPRYGQRAFLCRIRYRSRIFAVCRDHWPPHRSGGIQPNKPDESLSLAISSVRLCKLCATGARSAGRSGRRSIERPGCARPGRDRFEPAFVFEGRLRSEPARILLDRIRKFAVLLFYSDAGICACRSVAFRQALLILPGFLPAVPGAAG